MKRQIIWQLTNNVVLFSRISRKNDFKHPESTRYSNFNVNVNVNVNGNGNGNATCKSILLITITTLLNKNALSISTLSPPPLSLSASRQLNASLPLFLTSKLSLSLPPSHSSLSRSSRHIRSRAMAVPQYRLTQHNTAHTPSPWFKLSSCVYQPMDRWWSLSKGSSEPLSVHTVADVPLNHLLACWCLPACSLTHPLIFSSALRAISFADCTAGTNKKREFGISAAINSKGLVVFFRVLKHCCEEY